MMNWSVTAKIAKRTIRKKSFCGFLAHLIKSQELGSGMSQTSGWKGPICIFELFSDDATAGRSRAMTGGVKAWSLIKDIFDGRDSVTVAYESHLLFLSFDHNTQNFY